MPRTRTGGQEWEAVRATATVAINGQGRIGRATGAVATAQRRRVLDGAADTLARVIDACSVEPLDTTTIATAARQAGRRLVVVEDHDQQGGLGAAVAALLTATGVPAHLAVAGLPGSGTPAELLDAAGIAAPHIVTAARGLLTA